DVRARYAHIGEPHHRVVKRAQTHEATAISDLEAGWGNIDNEGTDLFAFFSVHHFGRRSRHHDEYSGFHAICAPKFFAIQDELRTIGRWFGLETHRRRIGAGVRLGQSKRRDFSTRHARKIFFLLFFGAKKQKRLRHTDRLMRGNERSDIAIPTAKQNRGASVIKLRQTEPAVLRRHFDAERADGGQAFEILGRNLTGAIDLVRIDMFAQISFEALQK